VFLGQLLFSQEFSGAEVPKQRGYYRKEEENEHEEAGLTGLQPRDFQFFTVDQVLDLVQRGCLLESR
jgi:hypothetical protein